jgi:hypothetical protein
MLYSRRFCYALEQSVSPSRTEHPAASEGASNNNRVRPKWICAQVGRELAHGFIGKSALRNIALEIPISPVKGLASSKTRKIAQPNDSAQLAEGEELRSNSLPVKNRSTSQPSANQSAKMSPFQPAQRYDIRRPPLISSVN